MPVKDVLTPLMIEVMGDEDLCFSEEHFGWV